MPANQLAKGQSAEGRSKRTPFGRSPQNPALAYGEKLEGPPPCFNFATCKNRAELDKGGRSVCRACAAVMKGQEFPLRKPTREFFRDYEQEEM